MSADLPALGAAGCGDINNRCSHLQALPAHFTCGKYRVDLRTHHQGGQPWRTEICRDEANRDAWAQIKSGR